MRPGRGFATLSARMTRDSPQGEKLFLFCTGIGIVKSSSLLKKRSFKTYNGCALKLNDCKPRLRPCGCGLKLNNYGSRVKRRQLHLRGCVETN